MRNNAVKIGVVTTSYQLASTSVQSDFVSAKHACGVVKKACEGTDGAFLFSPDPLRLRGLESVLHHATDTDSGDLIASCFTYPEGNALFLSGMFTNPQLRGQGFAGLVLDRAIAYAEENEAEGIRLVVRQLDSGLPKKVVALYKSRGFVLRNGTTVNVIKGDNQDRHLYESADPGGTFKTREMWLELYSRSEA